MFTASIETAYKHAADDTYNPLEENGLLPEKQKGCCRNTRDTKDQLLIDKTIMKN